ncbi:glycosyltransferase [Paracoccus sp. Z118]|uniref:nucleotide disphospho-sugar-binding domain-containing protein n=1 Tax=Paracoccus sp. Z118 TaxID=2851017 RepID=UPI001C2C4CFE|nr:glycosyltransferase [Paracoccus sp. Z118]MBV0893256.1 glycosyltransferase [Paracoccus sp. Z118]
MARIAFCLPALPSHAVVHGALARALAARGHDCRMVGGGGLGPLAAREGLGFESLGTREPDLRAAGLVRTLRATAAATRAFVQHGPEALGRLAPDLVIADQAEPGASLAAEAAGIPRVTLASALPLDRDEAIPPPFVGWPFLAGEAGRKRNRGGWRVADALMSLQARALAEGCRAHRLPLRWRIDEWISPDLDLRQMVPSLDFPHHVGAGARAVGPLRDDPADAFTLDTGGRPLVFASFGTLQGGRRALLAAIAEAAEDLEVCLALAHCGGLTQAEAQALPGRNVVRDFFPQRAVLARAAACVTHAGLNTVLDCAAAQVPMVAIPLAFEQPATAARLSFHGAARVVPPRRATRATIRAALAVVLSDPSYRAALAAPAAEIAAAGGFTHAADLIEARLAHRAAA